MSEGDYIMRRCRPDEAAVALEIINAAAQRYHGAIPDDCWREPYMPAEELAHEVRDGVELWGCERGGELLGVMGLQAVKDASLIRHAYVRPHLQRAGVGGALLRHLGTPPARRVLIGTWAAAEWAIQFYRRHGFALVPQPIAGELLRTYWNVPERQMACSVVLARDPQAVSAPRAAPSGRARRGR